MDTGAMPVWAQAASIISIALVAAIVGVFKYLKTEQKPEAATQNSVISASFMDSKLLRELIEALREHQDEQSRDAKKSHRQSQDLREAINELNESIIVQTDSTMNLIRFIKARDRHSNASLGGNI